MVHGSIPEARRVRCPSCGAGAPVLASDSVTCLYCLTRFALPGDVAAPIAAHQALGREVEATRQRAQAERKRALGPPWAVIAFGVAFFAVAIIGASAPAAFALRQSSLEGGLVIAIGLMVIVYGGTTFGVFAGVLLGMRNARLRLALTPFAGVAVSDRLGLLCPSCGAGVTVPGSEVVTKCAHCDTAALLPAAFVPQQLQRKHAALFEMRKRAIDARRVAGSTADAINESVGWAFIAIGVLSVLLFAVVVLDEDMVSHLGVMERLMMVVCSGGMTGGIFGGFGVMMVRNARKKLRR